MAVFDAIVNNADRKGGHTLLGPDGRVWLVDHGTCFAEEPKLRTVIWDWAGEPMPPELHASVRSAAAALRAGPIRARLTELLSREEHEATAARTENLAASGHFPEPGPDRHVPWPPDLMGAAPVSRRRGPERVKRVDPIPPFQRFLEEHRAAVYRVARGMAGPHEADDVFQETFLAAYKAYPRLKAGGDLKSWVLTIATRKAIDAGRKRSRTPLPVERLPEKAAPARGGPARRRARAVGRGRRAAAEDARGRGPPIRARPGVRAGRGADRNDRGGARGRTPTRACAGCANDGRQDDRAGDHEGAARGRARDRGGVALRGRARLALRLADEADVAYAYTDSPIGELLLAVTGRGLIRLQWVENDEEETLQELADKVSPRIVHAPSRLDDVRRELDEYFAGQRRDFDVPIDWRLAHGFTKKVLEQTARHPVRPGIHLPRRGPQGRVAPGDARRRQRPRMEPDPVVIPCHRVLRTGGGLGGYGGGLHRKRILLEIEGVLLTRGRPRTSSASAWLAEPVGRLATIDPDGSPNVVPFVFALIGDTLYTTVDAKPKRTTKLQRLANIERDPRVTVLADHYDEDWNGALVGPRPRHRPRGRRRVPSARGRSRPWRPSTRSTGRPTPARSSSPSTRSAGPAGPGPDPGPRAA